MAWNGATDRAGAGGAPVRRIIWMSFLLAVVVYGLVGYLVLGRGARPSTLVPFWVWGVCALFVVAASLWVPRTLRSRSAEDGGLRTPEIVGWALAETVAILGLVAVALGGTVTFLPVYLVVAAGLLWLQRPTD